MPQLIEVTRIEDSRRSFIKVPTMQDYLSQQERQYLADIDKAERTAEADECVLADMMGNRSEVDDFLAYTGSDVATLLTRLLTQGIPSRDGSNGDNEHLDVLVTELDRLRTEFEAYARTPITRESPMVRWERNREEDSL